MVCAGLNAQAQTLTIASGVKTFSALANTAVTMSDRSELRLTAAASPLTGCVVNLTSADAVLILAAVKPSSALSYLPQLRINGAAAVANNNCRLVQFGGGGTIILPHAPSFQPLQVFDGPYFTGASATLRQSIYYRGAALGALDGAISSFKLKRGYAATFAQTADGLGLSRNYVAQDGDLEVSLLPGNFDDSVRFIYVRPWRWTARKGIAGNIEGPLAVQWKYNWNISENSTSDLEYVPIRQNRYWPDLASQDWPARGASQLLGYNEPDRPDQANLSVAEAISSWPDLLATGLRVGAPAVSDGGLSWLYSFIDQADASGLRVDFVPVHYYRCFGNASDPNGAATQLYDFLKGIYDRVKRPLWITEWNNGANWTSCADPTFAQQQAAISAMINMLESAPFVERYAFYNWVEDVRRLEWDNGSLTAAGVTYRDKISSLAYRQAFPDNATRSFTHLKFDGDGLDSSGHGNNGVAAGSPAFANGPKGQAMVFDGANTVVTLPPNIARANGFTFAAWIYWSGGGNWQRIFDFGNSTTEYLFLTPRSGGGTLRFAIKNDGPEQIVETASLPINQWRHVAVTLSGSTARLFINGTLAASNTGLSILPSGFSPLVNFLGQSQFASDPLFNGMIDDVVIADTALSATQIAALPTNRPPEFGQKLIELSGVTQGQPYTNSLAATATDPDGQAIVYSKVSGPAWLTVSAAGALSGTPTAGNRGTNYFTVRAADTTGVTASTVIAIVVKSSVTGEPTLLAHYSFDGNSNDSSGHAFHGAAPGGAAFVPGKFGSAIDLNGTSAYATLPAHLLSGVTNFTIATWINWDGGAAWQRVLDFGNDTTQYLFLTPSSGSGTMRFAIRDGGAEQQLQTTALPVGQWKHVAITFDGATARLYVDGVAVAANSAVNITPASFNPRLNYIGKSQFPDPLFNGRIDETYLFNYALNAAEITGLVNNQIPPPKSGATLSALITGDTLTLSWLPAHTGARLQSNDTDLGNSAAWRNVDGSASTNRLSLRLDSSASPMFFRLMFP